MAACTLVSLTVVLAQHAAAAQTIAELPAGIHAAWDLQDAYRQSTATRERICTNGLWRWQPASDDTNGVPESGWGHFKVPGCWPGISDYMQKDCQTVFAHPSWRDKRLGSINAAWYQREMTIPQEWTGRRITLDAAYVNSYAEIYVDGTRVGEIRFPAGEVDLTGACKPGEKYTLSLRVDAMPLKAVMLSYSDTASAKQVKGSVARRGLCGDVYLVGEPRAARIGDVKVETSVRNKTITFDTALTDLSDTAEYVLKARVADGDDPAGQFTSKPFTKAQLAEGRFRFSADWLPEKLWDVHTPGNMFDLRVSLVDTDAKVLDEALPVRFGFREFWIDGRDFYLNGTRIFLSSVPFDNAQVGAAWSTYDAARESMKRLASFGINFVYTHNYGCEPGTHLGFEEILRAADDCGMLVAFSQPHFGQYEWQEPDAERTNGYVGHAEFYVRVAQNHPSVVAYSTSHNGTGYADDMNPMMIDGIQNRRNEWSQRNADRALRAEAIIRKLDPSRFVYHHAGGNIGAMHTVNFYTNFVPVQEMSDWFEHWATVGVKPLFTCEYCVPMSWDWTMYRGWFGGKREFGSAVAPWEFCLAEWNAQFLGDRAYQVSEQEKRNLRWEAGQFEAEKAWHRWDYPHQVGSEDFLERYPIYAEYFADNWPAFRTWGVSANSPWSHGHYWTLREGVDKGRKNLDVDWQNLQRPGFSPDYIDERYERIDLAFELDDWIPTEAAKVLIRDNGPLLAYIAGKKDAFTSKDHNFFPGETIEKQLIFINNSRETVSARYSWLLGLGQTGLGGSGNATIEAGDQQRIQVMFPLPADLTPGEYEITAQIRFSTGETQNDVFSVNVLPRPATLGVPSEIALFDPQGETAARLDTMGIRYSKVDAASKLPEIDLLIVGKNALTLDGTAPDITRVRDGLKVLLFEQAPEVLEQRFGFRIATYGLRRVFMRVPDHPILERLDEKHLQDWRGDATLVPSFAEYPADPGFGTPADRWCGIPVTKLWRCGNRGNVASVSIEKPARGDFLPILDGGYSLHYSPLMEYREGRGMMVFCQVDVTGRTEQDPAAEILVRNLFDYLATWQPTPRRQAVYAGGAEGRQHLESMGIAAKSIGDGKLSENDVLVVGSGTDRQLAGQAAAIGKWIERSGHVLALGLDEGEANTFFPAKVEMKNEEHIATWFQPFGRNSLLAGVSPADIHNAAPRKMPLLSGDAAIGDGVLGHVQDSHVVFSQMPPQSVLSSAEAQQQPSGEPGSVTKHHNLKRTYRRTSFLTARLLANMGVAAPTPILERFSTPLSGSEGESVVRNGDFALDADGDGMADQWDLSPTAHQAPSAREAIETEQASWALRMTGPPAEGDKKSSVMLAQYGVPMKEGQWYRISLMARAEGLQATDVPLAITDTNKWRSLFEYQRFTPESQWKRFQFDVRSNQTVEEKTRLQIWYEGVGTLWIADVRVEPIADPAQGRWLEGLYMDRPEEWDYPYRFFRW